jgi:hypothetical protein
MGYAVCGEGPAARSGLRAQGAGRRAQGAERRAQGAGRRAKKGKGCPECGEMHHRFFLQVFPVLLANRDYI